MTRTYYRTNPQTGDVERSAVPFSHVNERVPVFTDLYMDGHTTAAGVDIGSRTKRQAYMRAHNLTEASDFTETWARSEKERESFRNGTHHDPSLRPELAAALRRNR